MKSFVIVFSVCCHVLRIQLGTSIRRMSHYGAARRSAFGSRGTSQYAVGAPYQESFRDSDHRRIYHEPSSYREVDDYMWRDSFPGSRAGPNQFHPHHRPWGRPSATVQGNSRSTFSTPNYYDGHGESYVHFGTDGRPLEAEFEVLEGPNHSPTKMRVYSEDGYRRPFQTKIRSSPHRRSNVIDVRNTGPMEYPISGGITNGRSPDVHRGPMMANRFGEIMEQNHMHRYEDRFGGISAMPNFVRIDGKSLKTWSLNDFIRGVEVVIETDGKPMNATVELWGTGDHVKQVAEIQNEDGRSRPFTAYIDTPGGYNTLCIRNTGEHFYPMRARVEMH